MKKLIETLLFVLFLFFVFVVPIYSGLAWSAFQWRNPKANQMSFYRDFTSVMTWQKMQKYQ